MSMALAALGIDIMLPAFGSIRADFGLAADSTAAAGIVTAYLLGLAVGQPLYGIASDRFGRKPVLYVGYVIYFIAALAGALAPSLALVLVARFLWGLGAAGPRVMTVSIVRDTYHGEQMARAMSFIFAVFILVPVIAPSLGALIVSVADWRWAFGFCAFFLVVVAVWARRLPETHHEENRLELRFDRVVSAAREVVTNRQTLGYTLALTSMFGIFSSYLASSELIISDTFGRGEQFPLIFGALALVMGLAMLTNGMVVQRLGMGRLVRGSLTAYVVGGVLLVSLAIYTGGRPAFWLFTPLLGVMLILQALAFPNLNALAMEPMARIAGTAAAVIGTISTAGGALLGALVDRAYNGGVTPFSLGFLVFGSMALTWVWWANGRRSIGQPGDLPLTAGS
jgi:DHA1 family bicyclomycin/chloramphenicol resistance-like MFS transporter